MERKYKIFYAITNIGHLSKTDAKSLIEATDYLYPSSFEHFINDVLANGNTTLGKKLGNKYQSKIPPHNLMYEISFKYSDMRIKSFIKSKDGQKMIEATVDILKKEKPDLIVLLSPLVINVIYQALIQIEEYIPSAMVLTSNYLQPSFIKALQEKEFIFDKFIVISESVKKELIKKAKVDNERIRQVAYPVKINFEHIPDENEILNLKKHFDLPIDRRIVLFYGRINGYEHIEHIAKQLLKHEKLLRNAFFIIFTRNNQKQYEKLFKIIGYEHSFRVIGFSEQFYEYVSICDLLLTSAEPKAVKQGLMLKKPLIITSFMNKEEKENINFIQNKGYGTYANTPQKIIDEIETIILNNSRFEHIKNKYKDSNFKNGMIEIAREIIELMEEKSSFEGKSKVAKRSGFIRKRERD